MIKAVFLIASSLSLMAQAKNASGYNLVVYGGTVAAVEAALTARNAGAEVLLVTPRMYVGDDVVGTLSLVFDPSDVPSYDLEESEGRVPVVQTLFGTGPVTPLAAKQRLNELLARAGVERRFATVIRQVAHGKDGRLAAVELSDRSGCRFVPCSALVDATTFGAAAALAGAEFAPLQTGRLAFTRRVVAGEPPAADGLEVAETGLAYPTSIRYMNGFWGDTFKGMQDRNLVFGNFTAKMYACRAEVELPDATPSAWARVDGIMRERCYTRRTLDWSADLSFAPVGPLTACGREGAEAFRAKAAPEVFALSVRAAAEPKLRAALTMPGRAGRIGWLVGRAAAAVAKGNMRPKGETFAHRPLPTIASCDVFVAGGGTAGAPAAIAAARQGARTLLAEATDSLGGMMTEGRIGNYWYGNLCGFTTEVDIGVRKLGSSYSEAKAEWFRREIVRAGGEVWFGSLVLDVVVENGTVVGVELLSPNGVVGTVRCRVAIDATGNSLLAARAGAPAMFADADEPSLQATGWAMQDLGKSYNNTHLDLLDVTDAADVTRMAEASLRGLDASHWNQSQIDGSRERRRIVGRTIVSPLDILCSRTYPDTVTRCYSDFDSHGQSSHPIFFALGLPQNKRGEYADLPYRALLPQRVEGLLVTGLGISAHRDAMPILRMQPDVQNHGYAAGLAAALAVKQKVSPSRIDVRELQRALVEKGILAQEVLTQEDSFPLDDERLARAAREVASDWKALAPLMTDPSRGVPALLPVWERAKGAERVRLSVALGLLGSAAGEDDLIAAIEADDFADGWAFNDVRPDGFKGGAADRYLWALGSCRSQKAVPVLMASVDKIQAHPAYSHFRAYAFACERIGSDRLLPALASLLGAEGVRGHARPELKPLAYSRKGSAAADRELGNVLRELALARAIWRLSGGDATRPGAADARQTLESYAHDVRGVFAAFARRVLSNSPRQ